MARLVCWLLAVSVLCGSQAASAERGSAPPPQRTILHAGWLLEVPGKAPARERSILIEGQRIKAVRDGYLTPRDAGWDDASTSVVDLKAMHVLPGFIDLHVHLTTPVPIEPGGALMPVTKDRADLALIAARHAEITLAAGVTTVLDLGTGRLEHEAAIYALRNAVADGALPGPRILTVGSPISATGSSRTGLYVESVEAAIGPEAVCNGADACRQAVREQIKRGVDVISFYNTGSLGDRRVAAQTLTDAEMAAIVETAHALGRRAVADGHNAQGLNAALRAGADALISATWPDEETWKLLRQKKSFFVGHIYAFEAAIGNDETEGTMGWLPEHLMQRLVDIKRAGYAAETAMKRGIPMALGSDTGVIHHGDNLRDLLELVARGMTPMQALEMATANGAEALGLSAEIGTIEPGKYADIVATRINPLEDISAVMDIGFVMQSGRNYISK